MHTWVPSTPSPTLAAHGGDTVALADTVFTAFNAVSKGSDDLDEWYRTVMPRNLQRVGLSGGGLLLDYLKAVAREGIGHLNKRLEAFEGLCESFKTPKAGVVGEPPPSRRRQRP